MVNRSSENDEIESKTAAYASTRGRILSLALLFSGLAIPPSQAQAAPQVTQAISQSEAIQRAEAMVNREFKCLAMGGKTPEEAARIYFEMATGRSADSLGMRLVVVRPPEGPLRTTVVRVERMKIESPAEKAQKMVGKEFTCLAMGGKTPEEAARTYFAMQSGLSPEAAGVRLVIVKAPEGPLRKTVVRVERMPAIDQSNLTRSRDTGGVAATIDGFSTSGGAPLSPTLGEKDAEIRIPEQRREGAPIQTGVLSASKAMELWKKYLLAPIRMSYERMLKRNPQFSGKYLIAIEFDKQGKVRSVVFKQDTFKDKEFREKVEEKIRSLRISNQPEPVAIELPIVFSPAAD